jgi:hypothetical protein
MSGVTVANKGQMETDGTIVVANGTATDMTTEPTLGVSVLMYCTLGVFVMFGLFMLCVTADSMGRHLIRIGKRIVLADGSGHSSMVTEVLVFGAVLVFVGMYVAHTLGATPPANAPAKDALKA